MTEHENQSSADRPGTLQPAAKLCPETPLAFFEPVASWAGKFHDWARDVDQCYMASCGSNKQRKLLRRRCRQLNIIAKDLKDWADEVEKCFKDECGGTSGGHNHLPPPANPFSD